MIRKIEFLDESKQEINFRLSSLIKPYSYYGLSKKLIKSFIGKIFNYLSSDNVYVNIHDPDFNVLIIDDLKEMVINFLSHDHNAVFLMNFKSSLRHQRNKERDKLMLYHSHLIFKKFMNILDLVHNPSSLGGRPPFDSVLMYKIILLKVYYNETDE
ncbi:MAG: hypothetical protein LBT66_07610 [Methanobrevibacter sp.]|jgi:hypothetical protein|nr:hypothetical protein [Candidatus Methanovirga meridionalis]